MFYCDSCFFKLHKKSRFSCGHVLCKNCVYLDEINNGVCPLDKNSVWIENADNENAEKKKMQIEISEEIEQIEISEEIKQIEISEEIKQIEISEEIDQIEISEEIEQIEISEEIEDVKKETALLKYSADRLVRQNEIKDILKLQKDDIKLYLDEFMDSIDDRLETIDHTLYALTEKIGILEEKQNKHIKRYEIEYSDLKSSKALTRPKPPETQYRMSTKRIGFNFAHRWKLENFSHLQRRAWRYYGDEILYSQPFTCELGYNMCLLLCPCGIGAARGKFLSIYFKILEGPDDEKLKWPARFQVRFTMIDQLNNRNHHYYVLPRCKSVIYSPTKEDDTFCRGEKRFIHLNYLRPNYLVANSVCVQVDVTFL